MIKKSRDLFTALQNNVMPSLITLISGVSVGFSSRVREILRHSCRHGRSDENFSLLGCYSVYVGRRLPTDSSGQPVGAIFKG